MTTVAVFGGGPAGLMAAQTAAHAGAEVTVFEQGRSPGRKFLLAGRSGLNLTHSEPLEAMLGRYGSGRTLLEPHVRAFDAAAVVAWAKSLGETTFTGSSGRVFPDSFRAAPLLRAWLAHLDELGVELETRHRWTGWGTSEDGTRRVALAEATDESGTTTRTVTADAIVMAFGGASWPRTGSTGEWSDALRESAVSVHEFGPANCGVRLKWTPMVLDSYEGAPLKNVSINGTRGDVVITRSGLEGGPIYAHASSVSPDSPLTLDFFPDLSVESLLERLGRRRRGATVTSWLTGAGLSRAALAVLRDICSNSLPSTNEALARLLKQAALPIVGLGDLDRAISSVGGVRRSAVNNDLMLADLPGVFVCGEMIDWDAPTGGYLLQACLSTGAAAGRSAAAFAASPVSY